MVSPSFYSFTRQANFVYLQKRRFACVVIHVKRRYDLFCLFVLFAVAFRSRLIVWLFINGIRGVFRR